MNSAEKKQKQNGEEILIMNTLRIISILTIMAIQFKKITDKKFDSKFKCATHVY